MKLCKDCHWAYEGPITRFFFGYEFAECHHPTAGKKETYTDLTTGKVKNGGWYYCQTNRRYSATAEECGYDGALWEPRQ
jgi:hypothetical protein